MRKTYTFRQSWAKDFLLCPERSRRSAFDPEWDSPDTDATVLGTALHEYMESRLHGLSHSEAEEDAVAWLDARMEAEDFERIQIKGDDTLRGKLVGCASRMNVSVVPSIPPVDPAEIERVFDVPLTADGTIRLKGAWDARDINGRIWDWKTAAQIERYQGWEIDRWHVQPTFYCVAAAIVDLVEAHGEDAAMELMWKEVPTSAMVEVDFTYAVVSKSTQPIAKLFHTTRNIGHASWLAEQLRSFVNLYEGVGVDHAWPKNDQHALCSAKWCPAWDDCKGKHFDGRTVAVQN
jgi:hypothetical protein